MFVSSFSPRISPTWVLLSSLACRFLFSVLHDLGASGAKMLNKGVSEDVGLRRFGRGCWRMLVAVDSWDDMDAALTVIGTSCCIIWGGTWIGGSCWGSLLCEALDRIVGDVGGVLLSGNSMVIGIL